MAAGLVRMYEGEVLGKFPVVQHLLFSSVFPWDEGGDAGSGAGGGAAAACAAATARGFGSGRGGDGGVQPWP